MLPNEECYMTPARATAKETKDLGDGLQNGVSFHRLT